MNAKTFWRNFKDKIYGNEELKKKWNNTKEFTNSIIEKLENDVIKESEENKENDDVKTEREYFRIDLISYRNLHKNNDFLIGKLQNCSWDLITAVEHENDYRLWFDEVVKLAHVSCPLRVVIGYLPKSAQHDKYIKKVSDALKKIEAWNNTKNIGEFMIIIGNCKLKSSDEEGKCVYRTYVYDKENEGFAVPEWANES